MPFGPNLRFAMEAVTINGAALVVTLAGFGIFVGLFGVDPFAVYHTLYLGAFATRISIETTLTQAAPLMLTALCTAIPARAGLLVIGGEGALVIGGVATVMVGVYLTGLPAPLAIALMGLTGALAGGAWIGTAGALRQYRGVNETISTLLMNYIAIALMNHLVTGPIRDFAQVLKPASWSIPERFMVGSVPGLDVHWGLIVGIIACLLLFVLMRRTTFGFGVDILGGNVRAAQLAGLPINRMVLIACVLGGGAAGLAGTMEIVAVHGFASASLAVGFGYAGILIAFLARQNPFAIIFVAILVGGISASGGLLERRFGLPDATTAVLHGMLFMVVLASNTFYGRFRVFQVKQA